PDFLFKERFRPVIGLRLYVLTKGECHWPAIGWICHGAEGARQGGEKLFGSGDPVEIAADRTKTVIYGHGAVIEVFDLLQDGVRSPIGKDIARDEKDRQAVYMGEGSCRNHICCTGADGGGDGTSALAAKLLGIGNGCMSHGLLIVTAPCRQFFANAVERLAKSGHIPMAENSPDACDKSFPVRRQLICEIAHQSLRGGQSNCFHSSSSVLPAERTQYLRTLSQTLQRLR